VFSKETVVARAPSYYPKASSLSQRLRRFVPPMGLRVVSKPNFDRMARLLIERNTQARVLVLGAGSGGHGIERLKSHRTLQLVNTDISLGANVSVVCDAHSLPFASATFDGVVSQALLEHVVDPYRCVAEIHRVLVPHGIVYAETPFMQQVHGGAYDFTRFTFLGYRRLFRMFEAIATGPIAGPASVLAWSYEYLLLCFARGTTSRAALRFFARITGFWLKYLDLYLMHRPGAQDAAWGFFFFGQKSDHPLPDRELISLYRP
jgi:SAM-dependent methyltransferase